MTAEHVTLIHARYVLHKRQIELEDSSELRYEKSKALEDYLHLPR